MHSCSYPDCGKVYVNSSILKRHIQAFHLSTKRFQCPHCEKCLASRQNLKEHLYIHTGEKPYSCTYPGCFATFRQGTHLSAHKRFEHSEGPSQPLQYSINLRYLSQLISNQQERSLEMYNSEEKNIIILPPITGPYQCTLPTAILNPNS